jgi:hypothetical protein
MQNEEHDRVCCFKMTNKKFKVDFNSLAMSAIQYSFDKYFCWVKMLLLVVIVEMVWVLAVLGFELRALSWTSTLPHDSSSLFLVILEIGFLFFPRLTWTMILLLYAFHHCWGDRHAPPCPAFSPLVWGLTKFYCDRLQP